VPDSGKGLEEGVGVAGPCIGSTTRAGGGEAAGNRLPGGEAVEVGARNIRYRLALRLTCVGSSALKSNFSHFFLSMQTQE
jgi:hypothetical protein